MAPSSDSFEASAIRQQAMKAGIPLIGESRAFVQLLTIVARIAKNNTATVILRGETGTGKELVARALHYLSPRRDFPFVPVNCGALPDPLLENELFGHRPGAFTGATHDAMGLVKLAHRGTLFLDEVDALPPKAQVALLRFLQDGRFRPLGDPKEQEVDVRILAASNRCLENEIEAGRFRQDLYYRLNLIGLEVPPLRARDGDVQILSEHFLRECALRYRIPAKTLNRATLLWFNEYDWPGNIRELENTLHREYLLSDNEELCIRPPRKLSSKSVDVIELENAQLELTYQQAKLRILQEFDRAYLNRLIKRTRGNVTKAAQLAGKERRAFGKLLKRYRIGYDAEGLLNSE
jgi:transcriptional regulator with PAS, ATPase and Fis domain